MSSHIVWGYTLHHRFEPKEHRFKYPLYMLSIPVAKLAQLDNIPFFSYNKRNLFSIVDTDYLRTGNDSIESKITSICQSFSFAADIVDIKMVTIPRYLIAVFRPISFYLCYAKSGKLIGAVAEVSNTYKETQYYVVDNTSKSSQTTLTFELDKTLHVSPFFKEEGTYEFLIKDTDTRFEASITYKKDNEKIFYANFFGKKKSLTSFNLLLTTCRYPVTALLTLPRIYYQAFLLFYRKKIKAYSKPELNHPNMLRPMPLTWFQLRVLAKLTKIFSTIKEGYLEITLTDKRKLSYGDKTSALKAELIITHNWIFKDVAFGGEIGFGEAYIKGYWRSPNLAKLIEVLVINRGEISELMAGNSLTRLVNSILHKLNSNTIVNSKQNISKHYDLGNEFYKLFLDKTMTYSSAVFRDSNMSLYEAQVHKISKLITKCQLKKHHHILEIGSGWGTMAITIAKEIGCKVTTITLSQEQYNLVKERIKEEGVEDLVDIQIQDYRHVKGQFDRIISVEMIEAVGDQYLDGYFKKADELLTEGGFFVVQAITYPDQFYKKYKKGSDFIRKHIFPGGHLPSLQRINKSIENTNLSLEEKENIALSYAQTLMYWAETFLEKRKEILNLGFDDYFIRKFEYYFKYCEGAFRSRYLGCYQLVFNKK